MANKISDATTCCIDIVTYTLKYLLCLLSNVLTLTQLSFNEVGWNILCRHKEFIALRLGDTNWYWQLRIVSISKVVHASYISLKLTIFILTLHIVVGGTIILLLVARSARTDFIRETIIKEHRAWYNMLDLNAKTQ